MKKLNLSKKFFSGMLIVVLIASLGAAAFASDLNDEASLNQNQDQERIERGFKDGERGFGRRQEEGFPNRGPKELKNQLQELIDQEVISEDTVDDILEYLESKKVELDKEQRVPHKKIEIFEELVNEAVITDETAENIKDSIHNLINKKIEEGLNELIEDEIITEEQIGEIMDFMDEQDAKRHAEAEQLKDMTREERIEYFEAHKDEIKDPISQMVDKGIITEEQVKDIREVLPRAHRFKNGKMGSKGPMPRPRHGGFRSNNID